MFPAEAFTNSKDVLTAARALTFLDPSPKGMVDIGIAVDPTDPNSAAEASLIKGIIGDGLVVGDLTLHARVLTRLDANGAQGVGAILLTGSSSEHFRRGAEVARQLKVATISTNPACADAGFCAMLIVSSPKIQIFVNSRLAEQNHIAFTQTFSLLMNELPR